MVVSVVVDICFVVDTCFVVVVCLLLSIAKPSRHFVGGVYF